VAADEIDPDVPRDPLAAADASPWAQRRRAGVAARGLDDRSRGVLDVLAQFDALLAHIESGDASPPELTEADLIPPVPAELETIELSADEVIDAEPVDTAEAFVRAASADRRSLGVAQTIVLSGPEVKRKIRHRQSIMPSVAAQGLYEDIGALFDIGDREGALVSLERLLTLSPVTPAVSDFLSHNEGRLLEYYETTLGPWTRRGKLKDDARSAMPAGYFALDKMTAVVQLLDGRPLLDVIGQCGLLRIEACAVLSQLTRAGVLDLGEPRK
jgi:hypothetical protein